MNLSSAEAQIFSPPETLIDDTQALGAQKIKLIDMNADDLPDIVYFSNYPITRLAFLPNMGNLGFGEEQPIASLTNKPWDFADLNADGYTDMLIKSSNDVLIVTGDGLGGFNAPISYTTSITWDDARFADMDSDGDFDIVGFVSSSGTLAWLENEGIGLFSAPTTVFTGITGIRSPQLKDVDADGINDLVYASSFFDLCGLHLGLGDGNFGPQQIITSTTDLAWAVDLGDIDGDGDIDMVSASKNDNKLAWYANNGVGSFGAQQIIDGNLFQAGTAELFDYDNDGDLDVISVENLENVVWYENDGFGNFSTMQTDFSKLYGSLIVDRKDIDGDGDIDLVASSLAERSISIYEKENGEYLDRFKLGNSVVDPQVVVLADMDNDGDKDAVIGTNSGRIAWLEMDAGTWTGLQHTISAAVTNLTSSLEIEDFDNDGDLDVLVGANELVMCENLGNSVDFQTLIVGSGNVEDMVSFDFDSDGDTDILTLVANALHYYTNSGNLTEWASTTSEAVANDGQHLAMGYLDGDNLPDVAVAFWSDNKVNWYGINSGSSANWIPHLVSTEYAGYASDCEVIDVDGDGIDDVVFSSYVNDGVAWSKGDGTGSFAFPQEIASGVDGALDMAVGDIDMDGLPDLVVSSFWANNVRWYKNLGSGPFEDMGLLISGYQAPFGLLLDDFDGDGDLELFAMSHNPDEVVVFWNSSSTGCTDPEACNYQSFIIDEDGSCCYTECGCLDPAACNYDSQATCDDYSCVFPGCTASEACNYVPEAGCDDGSCNLPDGCTDPEAANYDSTAICYDGSCTYRFDGQVFFDENANGSWDVWESGLPFHQVTLEPLGLTAITNDEGQFTFIGPGVGNYIGEVIPSEAFPYVTTLNPLPVDIVWNYPTEPVVFGLSNFVPLYNVCVDFYPSGNFTCNSARNHNICYRNMGNVTLDGVVEVEYDPLFQGYIEVTPIDSVVGNRIYMSFANLLPGQMFFYDVKLVTPTTDFIGETLVSTARVYGYSEGNLVAFGDETLEIQLTCAYDPNDKQVFPNGYTDQHFILNDTELEYLIRFQNTGNAPAFDVLVQDTIDSNLDLSTFHLMANSHSVMTMLDPNSRVVSFFFENIMLPDSTNNEPESHGLISYTIEPYPALNPGTELNNTGFIYFDNNAAVVTNTTWSTIYNCTASLATIDGGLFGCFGTEVQLSNSQEFIESYQWSINGEVASQEENLQLTLDEDEILVDLLVENPLCSVSSEVNLVVYPAPNLDIEEFQTQCQGTPITLEASGAITYFWDGQEGGSTYQVITDSTSVVSLTGFSEFYCQSSFEIPIPAFPLPSLVIEGNLPICSGESITLSVSGAVDYLWDDNIEGSDLVINPNNTTEIQVLGTDENGCSSIMVEEVIVNPQPTAEFEVIDNTLVAAVATSYQWYLNGNVIENAVSQTLQIELDGYYAVEVWNEWDCSAISVEQFVLFTAIHAAEHSSLNPLLLYPNPATDVVTVNLSGFIVSATNQKISLTLTDERGRVVVSESRVFAPSNTSLLSVDVSARANGHYTLHIISEDGHRLETSLIIRR